MRAALKSLLNRSNFVFGLVRKVEIYAHALSGHIHDPDYLELAAVARPRLIADIGANLGQSIIALHKLFPDAEIDAFEPNPSCHPVLERAAKLTGARVRLHNCGIGSQDGALPFYVPVKGAVDLLQEGSFDRSTFDQPVTKDRIGGAFTLKTSSIPIRRIDDYGQPFELLKIDVQGLELDVLKGAEALLRSQRPVLFLERDDRSDDVIRDYLAQFGYGQRMLVTNCLYTPS